MSARLVVPFLTAATAAVTVLIVLLLGGSASSATGAPEGFPATPETRTDADTPGALPLLTEQRPEQVAERTEATLPAAPQPKPRPREGISRIAVLRDTLALRSRPGGPVDASLEPRTEFGSPRVLGVAAQRGRWLGLVTTARPNGRLAWADRRDRALDLRRTAWSLHADLSERRVELRRFGHTVARVRVAIGRPDSPTPTGRFVVTDKLPGSRFGPYYGCCILALNGYQEHLPAGWQGGNRIAIHGTDSPGTIGAAASAGCLRAADAPLATLMRRVPLGTPVFVRS
jgi:L,D-transpeptidase catalytic domain